MRRAWKIVLWIAVAMLAAGVLVFGAGLLTGGSVRRAQELAFGSGEALRSAIAQGIHALWSRMTAWF